MSTFLTRLKENLQLSAGLSAGIICVNRLDLRDLITHFERLDNEVRARYASDTNISFAEVKNAQIEEWQCSDGTGSGSFNDYSRDGLRRKDG